MMFNTSTKLIEFLFLATFLMLRVANFHAISHFFEEEHHNNCELCDLTITSQNHNPLDNPTDFVVKINIPLFFIVSKQVVVYETSNYCFDQPLEVYNKPPPLS